jgi:hypothetical protein
VALRTSLLDYFDDMLADNYLDREPGRTRDDLLVARHSDYEGLASDL